MRTVHVISKMVTDGSEEWLETMTYIGYTKEEAIAKFKAMLEENNLELA